MNPPPSRRALMRWAFVGTLVGVTAAVWYVNLRPNLEIPPRPAFPAFTLDRDAVPHEALRDPFTGSSVVRGRVTDASGLPLARAAVHAWVGGRMAQAATDAEGLYAMESLPEGPLRLAAGVEGYRGATRDDLFLDEGESLEIDFTLNLHAVPSPEILPAESAGPPQTLSGRCLDGNAGGTWYRVQLEPMRATDPLLRAAVETEARGTGFFRFDDVPAGRYRLRVTAAGGPARDLLEFARVEDLRVPNGELTVRFDAIRVVLSVHEKGAPTKALPRARAAAFWRPRGAPPGGDEEWLVARQRAEADGRIALLPVPLGHLRIVLSAPGYANAERELLVSTEAAREIEVELEPR